MLATETARNPLLRNNMTSALHSRGYVNGSTTSFGSSSLASSQPSRYGSNSTMRSSDDGDQKGLFPPPIPSTFSPPPPEPAQPDMNIMNRRAGADSSLYQICMNLRSRLADVPGFEDHIAEMEEEEAAANGALDPVTLMWNFLRRGYPLITIYNALSLGDPIYFDQTKLKESKVGKAATFKFLEACMRDLKFEPSECFLITDLYGEDTTGFVKVTKVVNRVLDILKEKGLLHVHGPSRASEAQSAPQPATTRERIIDEIVRTERDYVKHLEMLQQFQNGIQQSGALPGDAVHDIFLNLNALLDFQRRFLIRIEQQNSLPEHEQNWGKLFSYYKDGFRVYEPFLANQNRCNNAVLKEWKKLRAAPIASDRDLSGICGTPAILLGFLLKPFQRLSKYPLLLGELVKRGSYDPERHQDLIEGHAAAQSMMERAEEAVGKENRIAAVSELQSRVEDWKGHKIDHFGELLMFGSYTVLKGEGVKEVEREVGVIFTSLDPKTRACIISALKHQRSLVPKPPRTIGTLQTITQWFSRAPQKMPRSDLEGIPEEHEEGAQHLSVQRRTPKERSMRGIFRRKTVESSQSTIKPSINLSRAESSNQIRSKPKDKASQILLDLGIPRQVVLSRGSLEPGARRHCDPGSKVHKLLGVDTPSGPVTTRRASPDVSIRSKHSLTHRLRQFSPVPQISPKAGNGPQKYTPLYEEIMRETLYSWGHSLKFNGVFTQTTAFLFSEHMLPSPISSFSQAIPLEIGPKNSNKAKSEPIKLTRLEENLTNDAALELPLREQYKIYLFERILLCCKEINPNKAKNKMLSSNRPLVDKKGKPKLQLKGRIFMQNVTDVIFIMNKKSESPTFTLQIFWKGDPGVENFIIRFNDEATMRKWQDAVKGQQKILTDIARNSGQTGTSTTEFEYLKNQPNLKNPYKELEEVDEEDPQSAQISGLGTQGFSSSRTASSTSLRSMQNRMAPPRFPLADDGNGTYAPPLSVNTNIPPGASSPAEFAGNSYFSPSNDSPVSTRSSSQQSMYPFPRTQNNGGSEWPHDANKHRTAPAIGRAPSREGPGPPNSYVINGRTVTRPSLPAMAATQYPQQQLSATQSRLRSASTPDIHNPNAPGSRRQPNGQLQAPPENVPVPPIPAHMVQMRTPVDRSLTTSPRDGQLPIRNATHSPAIQRDRGPQLYQDTSIYDPHSHRLQQEPAHGIHPDMPLQIPQNGTRPLSSENGIPYPPQLKVTIWFDPHPSHVTIVVPIIIKHRSLIDRIDSKMVKVSSASIAKGTARLRYKDSDGDIVTIRSDEDVHIAIEDWGTANEDQIRDGVTPDFQLYWQQN